MVIWYKLSCRLPHLGLVAVDLFRWFAFLIFLDGAAVLLCLSTRVVLDSVTNLLLFYSYCGMFVEVSMLPFLVVEFDVLGISFIFHLFINTGL
jgi:hypothetical protein